MEQERVQVVLKQPYKGNVRGEVAWFSEAEAEKMVELGIADRYTASTVEPAPSSHSDGGDPEAAAVAALLKDGPKRTNYKNRQITSEA